MSDTPFLLTPAQLARWRAAPGDWRRIDAYAARTMRRRVWRRERQAVTVPDELETSPALISSCQRLTDDR